MFGHLSPLAIVALTCAALAAIVLLTLLFRHPLQARPVRVWLLFGLGVLPIGTAFSGNLQGYETTKQRSFCGSCHVMGPYKEDSEDPTSTSLASRHARNKLFGDTNCYTCHADYGMFGTITTKIGGMGHVYHYYTEYKDMSLEEAKKSIKIRHPFRNENCMQCHSTEGAIWSKRPDHKAALQDLREGRLSCASGGCHGFAHPWTKPAPATSAAIASPPEGAMP